MSENSVIKLDVFYKYKTLDNLNEAQIIDILKNAEDFNTAKRQIEGNYPSVQNIKKEELGIKIPFLTPRADITFTNKD